MMSRQCEGKLSTQLDDAAEDDDAYLSLAILNGEKNYVPDARELLSGEEEENDDDDEESAPHKLPGKGVPDAQGRWGSLKFTI